MLCIRVAARAWRQSSRLRVSAGSTRQVEKASTTGLLEPRCYTSPALYGLCDLGNPPSSLLLPRSACTSNLALGFGSSNSLQAQVCRSASTVIQFPLAQTGEGIKECELTEWFIEVRLQDQLDHCKPACKREEDICHFLAYLFSQYGGRYD